mgnify:FL=1
MATSPFVHPIRLAVAAVLSISAVSVCIAANAGPKENVNDIAYGVNDRLYYRSPAAIWEETLPLGNGRLGMMPDGGVYREHIVLNEISMWSGGESDYQNPDAAKSLPEIRRLLSEGKNAEAQEIMYEHFVTKKETYDPRYGCYQVLADLGIDFRYGTAASSDSGEFTDYVRDLSLADAVSHTQFTLDGTCYRREYFTSRDKDVFIVKLSADGPGTLDFTARLSREKDAELRAEHGLAVLEGMLYSGNPDKDGVKFRTVMKAISDSGICRISKDGTIDVKGAKTAVLVLSAATSFSAEGTDFPGDKYRKVCDGKLDYAVSLLKGKSMEAGYKSMLDSHIRSHRDLYGRVRIQLPASVEDKLPTDVRLRNIDEGGLTPGLAELYYNFGRYLLISSTRPGSLPPNLQGLWANTTQTPWNGDYHTNINLQMNYWPMEQAGLQELMQPLETLIYRLIPSGEETAKGFYGSDARGWVLHMMTNVWNFTTPGEHPSWGATNTGGAWLCAHLWNHYLYTGDIDFLHKIYPVMKGSADFFLSTMVREPKHGWLVTSPSSSPENQFLCGGRPVSVCMGPTMDVQILMELFSNTARAASLLDVDKEFADSLLSAISQFPPMQIGSDGRLLEWLEEYPETEPHHRHVSHLYGLHPGNLISPSRTPELAEACRKTLVARGDEATGWSKAWKICFWARLGDGDHALKLFHNLLSPAVNYSELDSLRDLPAESRPAIRQYSGTFPNLFCSHDPFQIDGNFGGASGIAEMLLQNHEGYVNFLPALPSGWSSGSVTGMRLRGFATIDFTWDNHVLLQATLHADSNHGNVRQIIKVPAGLVATDMYGNEFPSDSNGFIYPVLTPGESAEIRFRSMQ